ncbi:hypothetical protein TRVA0_003S04610 [Trichomonascus vanleenenianus]|uniref:uncharacterized protein n=1 Tax=Trichomonascus vanleenenianus TaxID=2268995 RepID=UPI003EC9FA36
MSQREPPFELNEFEAPRPPPPTLTYTPGTPAYELDNPYATGHHTPNHQLSPDLEQEPRGSSETSRARSLRSFFSGTRRSTDTSPNREGEKHDEGDTQSYALHSTTSRLLPIDEESEDEESITDIKDVVEELEQEQTGVTKRRGRRGHKNLPKKTRKKKRDSKFVRTLRNIYVALLSKTLFTRAFVYWFPLAAILFIPLAVGAWGNNDAALGKTRIQWIFIWLEVVWGFLWISRFIAHAAPTIFRILVGIVNPGWKKYSTVFVAMETALSLVMWALVSMITFLPIMTQNPHAIVDKSGTQPWQSTVQNILVALLISSLVYFAERLLIHFISVSFHKTRFAKRIKDNKLAIRVLAQMLDAAYSVFPHGSPEFAQEDVILDAGALMLKTKGLPGGIARKFVENKNVQQVVGNINKVVGGASRVLGNVGRDITGIQGSNKASSYNMVLDALSSSHIAEVLANRIWLSLVLEDADELTVQDLAEVVGEEAKADAEAVFEILDVDGNGNLTLEEMVLSVKGISKERKAIFKSLRDVDSAISKLHSVLLFVVGIIIIVIFIGMLAPSVGAVLATLGSTLLALSFVFATTAAEILSACVFLFVKHPYDVGDLVEINLPEGVTPLVVAEISLLYTTFTFNSTGKRTQCANATLNTMWVNNITRSGPMTTAFTLTLGVPETTAEDLELFKARLDEFLDANSRDFMPNPYFNCIDYPDLDQLSLCVSVTFRSNNRDGTLYGLRRTKLIHFLSSCVNEIPLHVPRRNETFNQPGLPFIVADSRPRIMQGEDADSPVDAPPKRSPMGMRRAIDPSSEEATAGLTTDQTAHEIPHFDGTHSGDNNEVTGLTTAVDVNRAASMYSRASTTLSRSRTTTGRRRKA